MKFRSDQVDEECDDDAVQEIGKQAAHDGHQNEGLNRGGKLLGHGLHIGHGVGGSTHAEATAAGSQDGGVIGTAHDVEHHEVGVGGHQDRLTGQQNDQRTGHLGQLPQLQGDHGDTQEQVQRDAADVLDFVHVDGELAGVLGQVTHNGGHDHGADVNGEVHAGLGQQIGDHSAHAHGDGQLIDGGLVVGCGQDVLLLHLGLHHSLLGVLDGIHQVMLHNEAAAQRTTHQAACHQTEGSRGSGQGLGTLQTQVLEGLAEGTGGAVAADHGDGAGTHTDQRINADDLGQDQGQGVLADDQHDHDAQEDDQGLTAALQHLQVGLEADGGKEHHHTDGLQGLIEVHLHSAGGEQDTGKNSKNQTADDRGGDTEGLQQADLLFQKVTEKQNHDGNRQGLEHIQRQDSHISVSSIQKRYLYH